jgi:hypothetical protein
MAKNMPAAHKDKTLTCGICKWFDTPYRGKTCKERRKVNEYHRACEEFEKGNYAPEIEEITKASFFVHMRKKLKDDSYKLQRGLPTELRDELLSSMKGHKLNLRFENPNKDMITLGKLFEKTQAKRERTNEIIIDITNLLNRKLYPMRELARGKVLTTYSELLKRWRTSEDRETVMNLLLGPLSRKIDRCENILEIAGEVIKNLDQSYWSLTRIKEVGDGIIERRRLTAQFKG